MLQVQMFGSFGIAAGATPKPIDCGTSARRLCAYLFAFPNRCHRREYLLELFWPELRPEQARAALSTALWKIQRTLSKADTTWSPVRATSQDILLELADDGMVDVHQFRSAVMAAFSPQASSPDCAAIDLAASLYQGPFLEEFDDHWVLDQRDRLHALYIRALGHLMHALAQDQRYEDALLIGRRIVAADPMREATQRAVMLLYVLNGQRGEAIQQYSRCAKALRSECDVEPMPETHALLNSIRSGAVFRELVGLREQLLTPAADGRLPYSAL